MTWDIVHNFKILQTLKPLRSCYTLSVVFTSITSSFTARQSFHSFALHNHTKSLSVNTSFISAIFFFTSTMTLPLLSLPFKKKKKGFHLPLSQSLTALCASEQCGLFSFEVLSNLGYHGLWPPEKKSTQEECHSLI